MTHPSARTVVVAAALAVGATLSACQGIAAPGADATTSQTMVDLASTMGQMRDEDSFLQAQVDSLRGVVAYQDTILRQLAGMAGVQMRLNSAP